MTVNTDYFDAVVRRHILVLQHANEIYREIYLRDLRDRKRMLSEQIRRAFLRAETPAQRMRAVERIARESDGGFSEDLLLALLILFAMDEVRSQQEIIENTFPWEVALVIPAAAAIERAVRLASYDGRTIPEWSKSLRRTFQDKVRRTGRVQVSLGDSPEEIDKVITGTVLKKTSKSVEGIVRTLVVGASTIVRILFAEENPEIFSEEIYSAVLDSRTTAICRSLDGNIYPIGEGPRPPVHFNCRSIRVPIVSKGAYRGERVSKSLINEFGRGPRNTWTDSDRSAFQRFIEKRIGDRPRRESYSAWLRGQSAEFQDSVLGEVRGKLFRRGNLPLDRFVAKSGSELSLSELARKERAAFRAAGLSPEDYID